jgi:hypothetical protein
LDEEKHLVSDDVANSDDPSVVFRDVVLAKLFMEYSNVIQEELDAFDFP